MTMPRETGAEKAAQSCANCGGPVGVVETKYGSTSAAPCPKCYPAQPPSQKASESSSPLRELGSQVGANAGSQEGDV